MDRAGEDIKERGHQQELQEKELPLFHCSAIAFSSNVFARYLLYTFIIDFSLEMLDLVHRLYETDESLRALDFMVHTKLYFSQVILQIFIGRLLPIGLLALTQVMKLAERVRKAIYVTAGLLALVGILAMRWNVVIGGQLFSKSFLGYTPTKWLLRRGKGCFPQ